MRFRRKRPCIFADECPRFTSDKTSEIRVAAEEIVGILGAYKREVGALIDDDEQRNLKRAALNRIAALEGALRLVTSEVKGCTCGALRQEVTDMIESVVSREGG